MDNSFKIIDILVNNTVSTEQPETYNFKIDNMRKCFILNLEEKIEIPFGFGPFNIRGLCNFIIDKSDPYLYEFLKGFYHHELGDVEFRFDVDNHIFYVVNATPLALAS